MSGHVRAWELDEGVAGRWAACTLLVLAFVTGGSSQRWGVDDYIVQALSVPVAAWAAWTLLQQRVPPLVAAAALTGIGLSLLPLLQLAPLPAEAWSNVDARAAMAADLAAVGVAPDHHWSLAPTATWRAWAVTLPVLACFLAVLAFLRSAGAQRTLLRLVVALAVGSMLLGILQMGIPADSALHPFPEWTPLFQGVFAHFNHQGTSVAIGLLLALALWLGELKRPHDGTAARKLRIATLGFASVFLMACLPLTTSRAAVTLAVIGVPAVLVGMGTFAGWRARSRWAGRAGVAVSAGVAVFGVVATALWMQLDVAQELRAPMRQATVALSQAHAPWGVGVGGFVPAFAASAPDALLLDRYINHAHNEYLQWWAEFGWAGLVAGAGALVLIAIAVTRAARDGIMSGPRRDLFVGAVASLSFVLAHSIVEYPLRTTALATVSAAMVGVLLLQMLRPVQVPDP